MEKQEQVFKKCEKLRLRSDQENKLSISESTILVLIFLWATNEKEWNQQCVSQVIGCSAAESSPTHLNWYNNEKNTLCSLTLMIKDRFNIRN